MSDIKEKCLTLISNNPVVEAKHKYFVTDVIAYKKTVQLYIHPTSSANKILFEESIAKTVDSFHPHIRLSRCPATRHPIFILNEEGIQHVELAQILVSLVKNYGINGEHDKWDNGSGGNVGNANNNESPE